MSTSPDKQASAHADSATKPLSVQDMLEIVWRGKWLILLVTVPCLLVGAFVGSRQPELYRSESRIYVSKSGPAAVGDQQAVLTRSKNFLASQAGLIGSTPVLEIAAEALAEQGFEPIIDHPNPVGLVRAGLRVDRDDSAAVLIISHKGPNPDHTAVYANALVKAYEEYCSRIEQGSAAGVIDILTAQYERARAQRDRLAGELSELDRAIAESELMSSTTLNRNIDNIESELSDLRMRDAELAMVIDQLQSRINPTALNVAPDADAIDVDALRLRIEQLRLELDDLSRLGDAHPQVVRTRRQLIETTARLDAAEHADLHTRLESVRAERTAVAARTQRLAEFMTEHRTTLLDRSDRLQTRERLGKALTEQQAVVNQLQERIQSVDFGDDFDPVRVVELETAGPGAPLAVSIYQPIAMGGVIGLACGTLLVFVMHFYDPRLRWADQMQDKLALPLLGEVRRGERRADAATTARQVEKAPLSQMSESYRAIRTMILHGERRGQTAQCLLVTSPQTGDGKSTLASNLGAAMARAGQRTVIIDGDLRRPVQARWYDADAWAHGLGEVLERRTTIDQAIQPTSVDNLFVVPAGTVGESPSELFESPAIKEILANLREQFDRVIIDSPPVIGVTDASILSACVDGVVLVVRARHTLRKTCVRTVERLRDAGANLVGLVINDLDARDTGHDTTPYYYDESATWSARGWRRDRDTQDADARREPAGRAR
ncbi:MAG: polysaccharide biosynthesis tyrosine autokinase [Planctomycetota bacterium]